MNKIKKSSITTMTKKIIDDYSIGILDTNLLIDIKAIIKFYKQKNPNMDNLYIQIDGVEFKLF